MSVSDTLLSPATSAVPSADGRPEGPFFGVAIMYRFVNALLSICVLAVLYGCHRPASSDAPQQAKPDQPREKPSYSPSQYPEKIKGVWKDASNWRSEHLYCFWEDGQMTSVSHYDSITMRRSLNGTYEINGSTLKIKLQHGIGSGESNHTHTIHKLTDNALIFIYDIEETREYRRMKSDVPTG